MRTVFNQFFLKIMPKAKKQNLSSSLVCRFTEKMKADIEKFSQMTGESESHFIRNAVSERLKKMERKHVGSS